MKHVPFYLPIPDDEVPYSTIVRYALLGAFRAPQAMKQVFGNPKKRIHPYLPGQIERFADFFELNSIDVIEKSTIYPLLKFTQPTCLAAIKKAMQNYTDDKVLLSTAIGHSRFRTFYGLSYCPCCVKRDIDDLGFAYWHIKHQIPGVQVCFEHGCLLLSMAMGDGYSDRVLSLPPFSPVTAVTGSLTQLKLAQFSAHLFDLSRTCDVNYRLVYQQLLENEGLVSSTGCYISISRVISGMSEYWKGLTFTNHLKPGVPEKLSSFDFLGRMLRAGTHYHAHPLKHLLFSCWLTDNDVTKLLTTRSCTLHQQKVSNKEMSDIESKVLKLLKQSVSLNKIEEHIGKSRCYIRRIAELNGITHLSNSQAYRADVRRAVLIKALYGMHRAKIAEQMNVGIGYVEQVIGNSAGMSEWRKHLRIQKNVLAAYTLLKSVRKKNPTWNRTRIRQHAESAYFVLYNHDKSLIEKVLPKALKPTTYKKDWAVEDARIFEEINKLSNVAAMSLSEIGRKVSDHGYLIRKLTKLPKSQALLEKLKKPL